MRLVSSLLIHDTVGSIPTNFKLDGSAPRARDARRCFTCVFGSCVPWLELQWLHALTSSAHFLCNRFDSDALHLQRKLNG